MKKENFKTIFKNCILISLSTLVLIALIYTIYEQPKEQYFVTNEVKKAELISIIPNVFNETALSTKFYQTPINLQTITIKEDEHYQINDFITNLGLLPSGLTYNYSLPEMNNYTLPGTYVIKITFKDPINNTIEKETNLIIEKKEEVIKEETPVKKETKTSTKKQTTKVTTTKKVSETKKETKPTLSIEERITNDTKKIGSSGRLYFNNLYSIALYQPYTSAEAQRYVDNIDSGSFIKYSNVSYIADHANQGFDIIKKQSVGSYVYLKNIDHNGHVTIDKYVIKEKMNGYNTKYQLLTNDRRDVRNTGYPLALYTCNSADGYHVTILLLNKVN